MPISPSSPNGAWFRGEFDLAHYHLFAQPDGYGICGDADVRSIEADRGVQRCVLCQHELERLQEHERFGKYRPASHTRLFLKVPEAGGWREERAPFDSN